MPIDIACLSCGYLGQVPDHLHGTMVACPRCKQTIMGPAGPVSVAGPQAREMSVGGQYSTSGPIMVPEPKSGTGNFQRLPGDTAAFNEPFSPSVMDDYFKESSRSQQPPQAPQTLHPATVPTDQPEWLRQFVKALCDHGILHAADAWPAVQAVPAAERGDAQRLAQALARQGKLSWYQAALVSQGKADQLVLGNYLLLDKVGEGGFGSVFKARHRRMQRVVALKVLLPELTRNTQALQRFQREVEAAAKLSHPNIVTAHDADEARGMHFLAMEFVDGPDLGRLLKKQGPLPPERAVDYVVQGARGLAHAHAAGIVHRDVKPSNLLVDKSGVVKVSDLGLARVAQPERGSGPDPLTSTRNIMGTVDFMAPEQALNTKTVDQRADIYSLGCTLYTLLTARPAYPGSTALEIVLAHREQPIPQLPAHCAALQAVFVRMMAKRVEDRYDSMAKVIADLQRHTNAAPGFPAGAVNPRSIAVPVLAMEPAVSATPAVPLTGSRPHSVPLTPVSTNPAVPLTGSPSVPLTPVSTNPAMPLTGSQPLSEPLTPVSASQAVPLTAVSAVQAVPISSHQPLQSTNQPRTSGSATLSMARSKKGKLWWAVGGIGAAAVLLTIVAISLVAPAGRGKNDTTGNAGRTTSSGSGTGGEASQPPQDLHALIRQAVKDGKIRKTNVIGGAFANRDFEELPADGGILIGFEVGLGKFVANDTIGYLRPIYRTGSGERLGKEYGNRPERITTIKAKNGYAVGGMRIGAGGVMDGLAVTFMRMKGKFLDAADAYESEWVGGQGGGTGTRVGGDGSVIVGLIGKVRDSGEPCRLGLIYPVLAMDWVVVFRSDDPRIWNDDVNKGPDHFAKSLSLLPATIDYLRLTNVSSKETVILAVTKEQIDKMSDDGKYGWEGSNEFNSGAHHLGIFYKIWPAGQRGDICVCSRPHTRGWGFGHGAFLNDAQRYSWEGRPIEKTVFEIAVKTGALTEEENRKLLKAGKPR